MTPKQYRNLHADAILYRVILDDDTDRPRVWRFRLRRARQGSENYIYTEKLNREGEVVGTMQGNIDGFHLTRAAAIRHYIKFCRGELKKTEREARRAVRGRVRALVDARRLSNEKEDRRPAVGMSSDTALTPPTGPWDVGGGGLAQKKIRELLAPRYCGCKPRGGRLPELERSYPFGASRSPGVMVCSSCGFPRKK